MSRNNMDLVVQFAILWGENIGIAMMSHEEDTYKELQAYDTEELSNIFSEWADEYVNSDCDDSCDFFNDKFVSLMAKNMGMQVPTQNKTEKLTHFCDDKEKMFDFAILSKEDFLKSYSYLTEEEYDLTCREMCHKAFVLVLNSTNKILKRRKNGGYILYDIEKDRNHKNALNADIIYKTVPHILNDIASEYDENVLYELTEEVQNYSIFADVYDIPISPDEWLGWLFECRMKLASGELNNEDVRFKFISDNLVSFWTFVNDACERGSNPAGRIDLERVATEMIWEGA